MSKGNEAADAIKRITKLFSQLQLAADVLDQYGSFEAAAEHYHAEAQKEQAKMTSLREKREATEKELKAAEKELENTLAQSRDQVLAARDSADEVCKARIAKAEDKAGKLEANAASTAERIVLDAQESVKSATAELEAKRKQQAELDTAITAKADEYAKLENQLADVKARISKMMG